jgi:transcription-repair coupling factor (superfamily II helicase)
MANHKQLIDFVRIPGFKELTEDLQAGNNRQILVSLPRAVRLPLMAALQEQLGAPILFVTSRPDRLQAMHEEYGFWIEQGNRLIFAEPTPLFYERASWDLDTRKDRLQTLISLAKAHLPSEKKGVTNSVIFTSAKSIMTRTAPRRDFLSACSRLKAGISTSMTDLARKWVEIGYVYNEIVVSEGQFSQRGGLMDIWPVSSDNPLRVDFFGDEIESIRAFDPASQRSAEKVLEILIPPASEAIAEQLAGDQVVAKFPEFSIPRIYPMPATLLDYLSKDTIVLIDNAASVRVTAEEIEDQAVKMRLEQISNGSINQDFPLPYVTWSDISDQLSRFCVIDLGFPLGSENHRISDAFSPSPRFGAHLANLLDFIENRSQKKSQFFIISRQIGRLNEVIRERGENWVEENQVNLIDGSLSGGYEANYNDGSQTLLFSDSEIFGWERERPRSRRSKAYDAPEFSYADLKEGDYVVHVDYGIGRFDGLVHRTIEEVEKDYLKIVYAEEDTLFVPVHQADRLSHYIGPDERTPRLTRLGGAEWSATKQRVRGAVQEVAEDLLELYAKRQNAKGFVFGPDSEWQKELEASFPFTETPDQEQAITEVKRDMENQRPMDRLLCGDVGYGKTEVALRAAFKAVMNGKQVAMLVPTTVLAQQHFDTFSKRLTPFPVKVEMLSRFRGPSEQAEILLGMESGEIDIVIGTHRLLQQDVIFQDLGLLIIDEEQRFGVTHKEFFKKMRTEIDVLTLTATPIPRTLYMALAGIRDISVINSPPSDRLPIHTYVGGYDTEIIRRAVIREIDRGGQVFFVHNRVQTIGSMASQLQRIVPEAKVGIAHGQMHERTLEEVMRRFNSGEIDVLLSTSIIESGLDIPNANTLIVDRGDTFGLSQLYQLRGRVGRGASRAYAYFFHHPKNRPTPEGLERLETIAENIQLGAGYSIAMRDLEMRGAGDLLGTMQHGHIASVGFHLYTRLLTEAVKELKKDGGLSRQFIEISAFKEIRPMVAVDLPLSVGIPVSYIPDEQLRLQLYRRLADVRSESDLDEIEIEFEDRFGEFGLELKNLVWQLRIKLRAENAGLAAISIEGEHIVLRFPPLPEGIKDRGLPEIDGQTRKGKNAYWLPIAKSDHWQSELETTLERLNEVMKSEEIS